MKELPIIRRLIIFISVILIFAITLIVLVLIMIGHDNTQETIAKDVLTITLDLTQQDCENITNTLQQSSEDNNMLLDYLHSKYNNHLTDNGYKALINNRIPTRAVSKIQAKNSDLKVTFVKLKPIDANAGSKRYHFILQSEARNDPAKTCIFSGNILLVKESGQWKVDGLTLD